MGRQHTPHTHTTHTLTLLRYFVHTMKNISVHIHTYLVHSGVPPVSSLSSGTYPIHNNNNPPACGCLMEEKRGLATTTTVVVLVLRQLVRHHHTPLITWLTVDCWVRLVCVMRPFRHASIFFCCLTFFWLEHTSYNITTAAAISAQSTLTPARKRIARLEVGSECFVVLLVLLCVLFTTS